MTKHTSHNELMTITSIFHFFNKKKYIKHETDASLNLQTINYYFQHHQPLTH